MRDEIRRPRNDPHKLLDLSVSSQHDQVMAAMERLGGIATLSQLYHATLSGDAEWKTKTPHATIRRIVQTNAAFYKIKPGLYCLAARKREFERAYQLPTRGPISPEVAQLNHSYYQGVLVEIGNAKGHCTYVPPQDKNKKFVSVRLGKISSTEKLPPFGYPNFLRHAKTVDVVWLNRRAMPHSLFEVELTTDMRISLLKFSELQDFYTTMRIVAPSSRLREFEDKISADAFYAIRRRVKFSDLDEITRQYEIAQRQAILT